MKNLLLFTLVLSLLGCESPPVRRSQILEEHPEWSDEMVTIITEGVLIKGMTSDQVRASWGYPCWSCPGTAKDDSWDQWRSWEYLTQVVFFDKDGKVTHWTKK